MNDETSLTIGQSGYWQLLELVASSDCEIDTDLIAEALDKVTNGDPDERNEGIQMIREEVKKFLPDGLS